MAPWIHDGEDGVITIHADERDYHEDCPLILAEALTRQAEKWAAAGPGQQEPPARIEVLRKTDMPRGIYFKDEQGKIIYIFSADLITDRGAKEFAAMLEGRSPEWHRQ